MAAANAARRSSGPVIRSLSPSPTTPFNRHAPSSSAFASAGISAFNSTPTRPLHRPSSPTRVNLYKNSSSNSPNSLTLRYRTGPSNRSLCFSTRVEKPSSSATTPQKRSCMCSPTNHPGSFRCSLHKAANNNNTRTTTSLNMTKRSAMKNSLVRIGTVEGDLVKRALAVSISPSSHQQRRRAGEFQPRSSRLSVMSMAS